MAGDLLLGIDVGTYSSKGVVCTSSGEVVASATVEHGLSLPRPGWAEQDADAVWWADTVHLCRTLLHDSIQPDQIAAVAVSAIGPCMLPVDQQGHPLRPAVLYGIDTRATEEIDWLNQTFGKETLYQFDGMGLTSQAIGPKILWLRRHEPDVYAQTAKILSASSYLVLRLTGETVLDRHSASYFNPLIDIHTLAWDDRFAKPIIELSRLPRLLWANEIAGQVTRAASAETGLPIGTPVTAGTIDAAAEAISVGVQDPGDLMVMYGTTMFFLLVTGELASDPRLWSTAYCFPGLYDITAGMATSGALTRWFRDEFAPLERNVEGNGGVPAYAALSALAAEIPAGANGLICLPYFSGERTPINDPLARGVFAGLTLSHTRAHLYRSLLEGTAYGVRHNIDAMRQLGVPPRRLVAVGGGAKNRLWLQIVSDVTGLPQVVPVQTIGASFGDAFLAGLATGLIPDRAAGQASWVSIRETIEPRLQHRATYDDYYAVYRSLYEHSRSDLHTLAHLGERS
ncbi:MAG TPA: FGGY-family carbohydrate kinase [Thermomicrobiales bacterium]|nr:FGGY-family carbohydrate kinase [Thermomicrobiales bacterium]